MRKPADSRFRYGPYTLPLVCAKATSAIGVACMWGKHASRTGTPHQLQLENISPRAGGRGQERSSKKMILKRSHMERDAATLWMLHVKHLGPTRRRKTWGNGSPKPGWSPHHVTRHPPGRGRHKFLRLSWWKNQHCNWPIGPRELWFVKFVCLKIQPVFFWSLLSWRLHHEDLESFLESHSCTVWSASSWPPRLQRCQCSAQHLLTGPRWPRKSKMGWKSARNYTLWLFNIAMKNEPFIDDVPINSDDFPWLC